MGYINKMEDMKEQLAEVLTQMAAAQQVDHEYVNATTKTTTNSMEAMMKMMLEQQKQISALMKSLARCKLTTTLETSNLPRWRNVPYARRKLTKVGH